MRKNRRITPEGTRDLLFEECLARREVEDRLSNLFVQRGFSEVMTPGIEFYDVVPGDNEAIAPESVYKLTDNKGRLLVIRPDSTTSLAVSIAPLSPFPRLTGKAPSCLPKNQLLKRL